MTGLRGTLRRTRWRLSLVATTISALLVGFALMTVNAAQAAAGCHVTYALVTQWQGGFNANVTVKNLGDPFSGWRLTWSFPSEQQVTHGWNANVTSSGTDVTATDLGFNAGLGTNGSVSFGFNGTWSGAIAAPTSFALNGVACTASVGPTTAPSVTPPPPTRPPVTTPPPTTPPPTTDAMAAVAAMQPGWNLGNSLDAVGSDETAWGNPRITPELLDNVRAQGFKSIRIPVTLTFHFWSGEKVTYRVTNSGTTVTGTTA